jgi:hypothetical protein
VRINPSVRKLRISTLVVVFYLSRSNKSLEVASFRPTKPTEP